MAARLRMPTLAFAALSIGLNIAIIGCAGRTLNVFNTQRYSNAYFLPIWSGHFDTRELSALIGTSTVVFVLNLVLVAALFVSALPANFIVLASSLLSSIVSLIAIIFSAVLNNNTSRRDTLQSWTCRWRGIPGAMLDYDGVPREYDSLCNETRFAFFTTIPVFLIQLLLLSLAVYAVFAGSSARGVKLDEEKDHELNQVRQQSFDTKDDSPRSMPDSMRIIGVKE